MNRVLVDVDTQNDFIKPNGNLFVPTSYEKVGKIKKMLLNAEEEGVPIIGSVDSHSYDSWEYEENGGPFPGRHCYKGTPGWTRYFHNIPIKKRFVPISANVCLVGESKKGEGTRIFSGKHLAIEAINGVGIYFEKEVYSLFSNPIADFTISALVNELGGKDNVVFDVIGYCAGGYCVDAAALGLKEREYNVRVYEGATAAIGEAEGIKKSKETLTKAGVEWIAEK